MGLAHRRHPIIHSHHDYYHQVIRQHKAQPPQAEGSTTLQQAARPKIGWEPWEEAIGH